MHSDSAPQVQSASGSFPAESWQMPGSIQGLPAPAAGEPRPLDATVHLTSVERLPETFDHLIEVKFYMLIGFQQEFADGMEACHTECCLHNLEPIKGLNGNSWSAPSVPFW